MRLQGTQWNGLGLAEVEPVHAPEEHPLQGAHCESSGHCESLVHQHGTPDAAHAAPGDVAVSQLPMEQDQAFGTELTVAQPAPSAVPVPVHVPVHWPLLTHLPLEQSLSATHRQPVLAELSTGVGESEVVQAVPPLPLTQATEFGGASHPLDCALPLPVQLEPHDSVHLPLTHWSSLLQTHEAPKPKMPPVHCPLHVWPNPHPPEGADGDWHPR
jgi:hypothetical protein